MTTATIALAINGDARPSDVKIATVTATLIDREAHRNKPISCDGDRVRSHIQPAAPATRMSAMAAIPPTRMWPAG